MTHTLEDLKLGKLIGSKRLKLACGLKEFPKEILTLANTLEVLDLSDNQISELPSSITQLRRLRILFFAHNSFTEFPTILRNFPELQMIGFKSNQIQHVFENSFPPKLNWLILTNNKITSLPKSLGDCHLLQKCALAGNLIQELPPEMVACKNLELIRISANRIKTIPSWLFELPKLAWVAFGGNPGAAKMETKSDITAYPWNNFSIKELLGEGASGFISKALWNSKQKEVAIKIFKGDVTSDGLPDDEMRIAIAAGKHKNLIPVLGKITAHPEAKIGLIMKLITADYVNLGNPPSLETCTRDTYEKDSVFTGDQLLKIAKSIASVCAQLHKKGINHGDLYAHNILVNTQTDCLLGDFGAATYYANNKECIERVEVRAFGCLLEDIFTLADQNQMSEATCIAWQRLIADCFQPVVINRPGFIAVIEKLKAIG